MKLIRFQGVDLEVDSDKTKALATRYPGLCQCDFCTNARITERLFVPKGQVEILQEVGAVPWNPTLSAGGQEIPGLPPSYTRRLSCWFVYGKIVGQDRTSPLRFDRWNWMWADTSRAAVRCWDGRLEGLDESSMFYLIASNALPWLHDEVCGFRQEFVSPCSVCGSRWRETGYLKRRSLIPEWYEVPELCEVLLARKRRVLVGFCTGCGQMEHRIVEDEPPFRRKSKIYRDYVKQLRAHRVHVMFPRMVNED